MILSFLKYQKKKNAICLNFLKKTLVVFLVYSTQFFTPLFAQTDSIKLEKIEVKAQKLNTNQSIVSPTQAMDKKALKTVSGNSAGDVVKNFSGVVVKDYGGIGGFKTLIVRGLGANHTGVFVDGVSFGDIATGQIDLGKVSILNAENISLTVGQPQDFCQPAKYYSTASVLNIRTQKVDFTQKKASAKIGSKIGSFGLVNPYFSVQNKIGRNSYSSISANFTKANGEYSFRYNDSTYKRQNSDIKSLNFDAFFATELKSSSKLLIKIYNYNSNRGLPGAVILYNPHSEQRLQNNDLLVNINLKNSEKKKIRLQNNFKFSQNYLRYRDPNFFNAQGGIDSKYLQQEYYFSQALSMPVYRNLTLSFAGDIFINSLKTNSYTTNNPIRTTLLPVVALHFKNKRVQISGNLLARIVREKNSLSTQNKFATSPTFLAGYRVLKKSNIQIRFLYKDIFRMPTFNDLYYNMVGNINLKPEFARQINLGATTYKLFKKAGYFSAKTDFFHNRVKNKIVAVPTKNLFVWSVQNIGKVYITGFEIQAGYKSQNFSGFEFSATGNYTLQRATDLTDNSLATYQQQIPYIPFETSSTIMVVSYKNFSVSYNWIYNGFRYILGENNYQNILPEWHTSDISFIYEQKISATKIEIKAEANNLANTHYEVIKSYPMPGHTYFLTVNFSY